MSLNQSHRLLLSLSASTFVIAVSTGSAISQQINNQNQGHIVVSGPIYKDTTTGAWESLIANGANNSITIVPLNGPVIAGTVRMEGGAGLIATDTDFIGGERTGAVVLARDHYAAGSYIELTNSNIIATETSHESRGLEVRHTARATMNGGSITSRLTSNIDPVGLLAWSGGGRTAQGDLATINVDNIKVYVSDTTGTVSKATGSRSVDGGQIFISNSVFNIGNSQNEENIGLQSIGFTNKAGHEGTASFVSAENSIINVHGDASFGAKLEHTGSLATQRSIFNVTGDNSIGVSIADGSSASISGGMISTSGVASTGLTLDGEAIATLTDTAVDSNGIVASLTDINATGLVAILSVDNSQLTGLDGIFSANGGVASVALTNSSATTTGDLINAESASDIDVAASNSVLEGDINGDDTSTITVMLEDRSTFTGAMNVAQGGLEIDQTSRWAITSGSSLVYLSNNGVVSFASILGDKSLQSNYNTLNLERYTSNNGAINFNTHLGDDSSATDQLVVSDIVTGTTKITVNNTDGLGAQTNEGIQLIVAPNSQSDAFTLSGDYSSNGSDAIVAGAYAYRLHQGNTSGSNDSDWFLRSELKDGNAEYQAGAPVYEAYPQALLGLNGVSTLQQRVGNRVWAGNGNNIISQGADVIEVYAPVEEAGALIEGNGVWGRIEGSHTHMEPKSSTTGTNYNQDVFKLQAGIDGLLNETESGKLIGGVQLHYIHGNTKTKSSNYADGKISTDGYGFSGTLTWYDENGFYADGQAQFTWYDSDLTTSAYGAPTLEKGNNGFGYTLSVEAGKRVTLNDAWSMTPQGQLVYSHVKFDDFTDAFGAAVNLDKARSLQGRLGITLDRPSSWQSASGMMIRSNIYGIANMYYEFLDGAKTDVSGVSFANKNDRLWAGVGMGGSYNWNDDKYSLYGEGLINTSLNNFGDSYTIKGNIGFRVKW